MADITVLQNAYTAGFFDGEGWVRLERIGNKEDQAINIEIGIGQNVLEPLEFCKALFGGHIYLTDRNPKNYWRWQLNKRWDLLSFCLAIQPYLIRKKTEIDLTLILLYSKSTLWTRRDDWLKAEETALQEAFDEFRYGEIAWPM